MTNLTPQTLAELRLLLDKAPPLPYRAFPRTYGNPSDGPTYIALEAELRGRWEEVATGNYDQWSGTGLALAAAAVNVLPSLLAATDELAHMTEARDNARAEVERLTATVIKDTERNQAMNPLDQLAHDSEAAAQLAANRDRLIVEARQSGATWRAIATAAGRTELAVRTAAKKANAGVLPTVRTDR